MGACHQAHLLNLVLLRRLDLVFAFRFYFIAVSKILVSLLVPLLHVRTVGTIFTLFDLLFGLDLRVEHFSDLPVLLTCLHLLVQVVQVVFLVFLDALRNVLAFLLELHLFVSVVDHVCHFVHHRLDAGATLFDLLLSLFVFLFLLLHVALYVSCVFQARIFDVLHSLSLFLLIFANDSHRSLSFLLLLVHFGFLFTVKFSDKLLELVLFVVACPSNLLVLLRFRLLEHIVTHLFGSDHLLHLNGFLFVFFLHLVLSLSKDLLVKVLFFELLLLFKLSLQFDLLVEHVFDLLRFYFMLLFDFALGVFMQPLPVSLDFTPLVVGDV